MGTRAGTACVVRPLRRRIPFSLCCTATLSGRGQNGNGIRRPARLDPTQAYGSSRGDVNLQLTMSPLGWFSWRLDQHQQLPDPAMGARYDGRLLHCGKTSSFPDDTSRCVQTEGCLLRYGSQHARNNVPTFESPLHYFRKAHLRQGWRSNFSFARCDLIAAFRAPPKGVR